MNVKIVLEYKLMRNTQFKSLLLLYLLQGLNTLIFVYVLVMCRFCWRVRSVFPKRMLEGIGLAKRDYNVQDVNYIMIRFLTYESDGELTYLFAVCCLSVVGVFSWLYLWIGLKKLCCFL